MSETLVVEHLLPKIYINSFPKSGTHLAILITLHMAQIQKPKHWCGSFHDHSWTNRWISTRQIVKIIKGQQPGTWMMGHMGYKPAIERAFREAGTCMLFVYRDLRDVAVSQTYHIENPDDETFKHRDKALYMALPDHAARLQAVIEGIGKYPPLIERWELFAPWLDVDWVMPIRYEEMRQDPEAVASRVVDYVIKRTMDQAGYLFPLVIGDDYKQAIYRAIRQMGTTEHSGSFRTGRVGDWRDEFTPAAAEAFARTGGDDWIERLGYGIRGKIAVDPGNGQRRIAAEAPAD